MPNEELKAQNIENVLLVSYDLFLEYGIERVTWEMISRASGLSRRTIDRYFFNKTDCVLKSVDKVWSAINQDFESKYPQEIFDGRYTGVELLRMYMGDIKALFLSEPRHFILYDEFRMYVYRNCDNFQDGYKMLWGWLGNRRLRKAIYHCGKNDGSMRANIDIYTEEEYFSNNYLGFLFNLAISFRMHDPSETEALVDRRIEQTVQLYTMERINRIY